AATSSLPVPRSPTTSTGRSSAASCETCAKAARKAGASPTSGGRSRSVLAENTESWPDFPYTGKFHLSGGAGKDKQRTQMLVVSMLYNMANGIGRERA